MSADGRYLSHEGTRQLAAVSRSSGYFTGAVVAVKNTLDVSLQFYFAALHPDPLVAPFPANFAAVRCKDQDSGFFHECLNPLLCLRQKSRIACDNPLVHQNNFGSETGGNRERQPSHHA